MHQLKKATRWLRRRARRALRHASGTWQVHRRQMTDDPHYAERFTDVLLGVAELLVNSYRVWCLVHALGASYVWVLRALGADPRPVRT